MALPPRDEFYSTGVADPLFEEEEEEQYTALSREDFYNTAPAPEIVEPERAPVVEEEIPEPVEVAAQRREYVEPAPEEVEVTAERRPDVEMEPPVPEPAAKREFITIPLNEFPEVQGEVPAWFRGVGVERNDVPQEYRNFTVSTDGYDTEEEAIDAFFAGQNAPVKITKADSGEFQLMVDAGQRAEQDSAPVAEPITSAEVTTPQGRFWRWAEENSDAAKWIGGRARAFAASMTGTVAGTSEYLSRPQDIVFGRGFDEKLLGKDVDMQVPVLQKTSDKLRDTATTLRDAAHETVPDSPVAGFLTELTDSIIMMAPSIITARVTKSGKAGMAVMGTMVFGDTITRELASGAKPEEAIQEAWMQVALELGPEKAWGWFDSIAVSKGAKQYVKNMLVEGMSELTTEELSMRHDKYNKGEDIDLGSKEAWINRFKATIAGMGMSGVLTAPSAFEKAEPTEAEQVQKFEESLDTVLQTQRDQKFETADQPQQRTPLGLNQLDLNQAPEFVELADGTRLEPLDLPEIETDTLSDDTQSAGEVTVPETDTSPAEQVEDIQASVDEALGETTTETETQPDPNDYRTWPEFAENEGPSERESMDRMTEIDEEASELAWQETADERAKLSDAVNRDINTIRANLMAGRSIADGLTLRRAKVLGRSKILEGYGLDYADFKLEEESYEGEQDAKDEEFVREVALALSDKYVHSESVEARRGEHLQRLVESVKDDFPRINVSQSEENGLWRVGTWTRKPPHMWQQSATEEQSAETADPDIDVQEMTEEQLAEELAKDDVRKPREKMAREDMPPMVVQEDGDRVSIEIGPDGGIAGTRYDDGTTKVETANLPDDLKGVGIGKAMYEKFIEDQHRKGQNVMTGGSVTEAALRVWQSLERDGKAKVATDLEEMTDKDGTKFYLTKSGDPVAVSLRPEEGAPATPAETPARDEKPTGLAHDVIEQERIARGAAPLLSEVKQSQPETVATAEKMLDNDPTLPDTLVETVTSGDRTALSTEELAVLLLEKVRLDNEYAKAQQRAGDGNLSSPQQAAARKEQAELELKITKMEMAARIAGTESGRSLAFRQALMKKDYSLASLKRQMRAIRGRALTPEENTFVEELQAELAAKQKELDDVVAERDEMLERNLIANQLRTMTKDLKSQERKERKWLDTLDTQADVSRAWLASQRRSQAGALVNPAAFYHLARIGASHVAHGAVDFADWVVAMKRDLGERWGEYQDDAEDIFAKSQALAADKKVEGPQGRDFILRKALAEQEAGAELSHQVVYGLAKWHVNDGKRGEDTVMQAVHDDLVQLFPELTEREVRRKFVNYGMSQNQTKTEVQQELAEIAALVKLTEEITRMENDEPLAKNDKERKRQSDALKNKKRKRDALMRRLERTNPEMREERYKRVNEQRLARLESQLEALNAELQGAAAPERGPKVPESPEVLTKRAERDALQQTINEIKEANQPKLTEEEKWNNRRTKQLERRKAELEQKLKNKDFAPKPKPTPHRLNKANRELLLEVNNLQQEFLTSQYRYLQKNDELGSRIARVGVRSIGVIRGLQASSDLSGVGRQGFPAISTFPKKSGIPTILAAFSAAISPSRANAINQAILDDPTIAEARSYGLYISDPKSPDPSKLEEEFMDRFLQNNMFLKATWIIPASIRSYMTSLNVARATFYKALADEMFDGVPSPEEGRQIASLVNNATGRGMVTKEGPDKPANVVKVEQLANGASMLLYAPRFTLSRFLFPVHMLAGFVPFTNTSKEVQKARRKSTYRTLGALTVIKALMTFAAMGLADPDDEISWNFNPTSTDFMRVKIKSEKGTYRLDPTLGMGAGIVLLSRLLLGVKTDNKGVMHPLRETASAFTPLTGREIDGKDVGMDASLVTDFMSYKMSPALGLGHMIAYGRNIVGDKVTPLEAVSTESVTPLIVRDWVDAGNTASDPALMGILGLAAFMGWPGSGFANEVDEYGRMIPPKPEARERDDEGAVIRFR